MKKRTMADRWQALGSYRVPLVVAVVFHLVLLSSLFVHFNTPWQHTQMTLQKTPSKVVVQAHSVSIKSLQAYEAKVKAKKQAIARAKAQAMAKARAARLAKIKAAKLKAARIKAAKAKAAKLKALKLKKAKALALKKAQQEKARLAAVAAKKRAAQQAKAAKIAKAQKLAKLKAMQQKLQQAILNKQLSEDKSSIQSASARLRQQMVNQYTARILSAVGQNWLIPRGTNKDLECVLHVRLAPGGVVLNVSLAKSSGDQALDRSAVTAVYKASPLPVPKDPAAFSEFRQIDIKMQPKTIVAST